MDGSVKRGRVDEIHAKLYWSLVCIALAFWALSHVTGNDELRPFAIEAIYGLAAYGCLWIVILVWKTD